MEYQQADRDYIRLSIAFEGRAKQANELLRNFDSISELFEAIKNVDFDILTMIKGSRPKNCGSRHRMPILMISFRTLKKTVFQH